MACSLGQLLKLIGGRGVAASAPVNTVLPVITGTAREGQTLSVLPGTWSGTVGSRAYQWTLNGVDIPGAIATTLLELPTFVTGLLRCRETATNAAGSTSATSLPTAAVLPLAPVAINAPQISGLALVGQVLTRAPAIWNGSPTSVAGQWLRSAVAIGGQTGATYTAAGGDTTSNITYQEIATNAGGDSVPAVSNAIGPISDTPPDPGIPVIAPGTAAVGAWAETDPAALGIGTQGAPSDPWYEEQPTANWVDPMFQTVRNGALYIGVVADAGPSYAKYAAGDPFGIKEVRFSCANGAWTTVSARTTHPTVTGRNGEAISCFVAAINTADFASSGLKEIRAIVVPWAGRPFVLQVPTIGAQTALSGKLNPVTAAWVNLADPGGSLNRNNWSPGAWSLLVNIDKTGSALPNVTVWLDTINGNPAGTGLSRAQAVKTGAQALAAGLAAKLAAGFSGTDAGGITITYTGAGAHAWGIAGTPAITPCAAQYLRITYDPLLAATDIDFTSAAGSYGWNCEKVELIGCTHTGNFTLEFGNAAGNPPVTYFDTLVRGLYSEGPAGVVDQFGQPAGANTLSQMDGHNTIIGCTFKRRRSSGTLCTTLSTGNIFDNLSTASDILDDVKVSIWDEFKNLTQSADPNHLDCIQLRGGRTNHMFIDLTAVTAIDSQVLFGDERCGRNISVIRPRITSTSTGSALGYEGGAGTDQQLRAYHVHDPIINGGTKVPLPQSGDMQNVSVTLTNNSVPGKWTDFRFGKAVLWPTSAAEPVVDRPAVHALITQFGLSAFAFLLDAEEITSLSFTDGSQASVVEARNIRSPGGPRRALPTDPHATTSGSKVITVNDPGHPYWTGATINIIGHSTFGGFPTSQGPASSTVYTITVIDADHYTFSVVGNASVSGVGGGVDAEVSLAIGSVLTPARLSPAYDPVGLNGRPCLVFDPDNAVSTAGRSLFRSGEALISGANVVHEFFLVNQEEADAIAQSHHLCTYGGSSSATQRMLYRSSDGTTPKLNWRTGSAAAIAAPGAFRGVCVVHAYYDPTLPNNVGVGLFNAAQPSFVFNTSRYTFGTVATPATTSPGRLCLGGGSTVDGGSAGQWLKFRANIGAIFKQSLSAAQIQFVVELMIARGGF